MRARSSCRRGIRHDLRWVESRALSRLAGLPDVETLRRAKRFHARRNTSDYAPWIRSPLDAAFRAIATAHDMRALVAALKEFSVLERLGRKARRMVARMPAGVRARYLSLTLKEASSRSYVGQLVGQRHREMAIARCAARLASVRITGSTATANVVAANLSRGTEQRYQARLAEAMQVAERVTEILVFWADRVIHADEEQRAWRQLREGREGADAIVRALKFSWRFARQLAGTAVASLPSCDPLTSDHAAHAPPARAGFIAHLGWRRAVLA